MDLDDVPINPSSGNAFPVEEQVETFDHLPFAELLAHKNWKARKTAFDMVSNSHPDVDVQLFSAQASRLAKESNAAALDSYFEAVAKVIMDFDMSVAEHIINPLFEKGLVSRRPAAANFIIAALVEKNEGAQVFEACFTAWKSKLPKVRLAAVACAANLIHDFGFRCAPAKPLMKNIAPLFNETDAKIRKEAQRLVVECYRYVGDGIKPFLCDLRDVQQQELDKIFATTETGAVPTRAMEGARVSAAPAKAGADALLDCLGSKAVMRNLSSAFFATVLDKSLKFKERVDCVNDQLLPLITQPKMPENEDYTELIKCLRDLINDNQMPIYNIGIRCVREIASSLRQHFAPFARFIYTALFDKFKEKSKAVLDQVSAVFTVMLEKGSMTFDSCFDDLELSLTNKLPNQRQATAVWLTKAITAFPALPKMKLSRANGLFSKLIGDEKIEVREAALNLLTVIVNQSGPSNLKDVLSRLDDKQRARVAPGSGGAPALNIDALNSAPLSRTASATSSARRTPAASASSSRRETPVSSRTGTPTAAALVPPASNNASDEVSLEQSLPAIEVACATITDFLSAAPSAMPQVNELLTCKEWRGREAALNEFNEVLCAAPEEHISEPLIDCITVWVRAGLNGWKENLFQVWTAAFALFTTCVSKAPSVSNRASFVMIAASMNKWTDAKLRTSVANLLSLLTENLGPKNVTKFVSSTVSKMKNPKLTVEAVDWIDTTVREFATAPIDAKYLVDFVKTHIFDQPQANVRSAGARLMATLRLRVGPKLEGFYSDINQHLRSAVDDEVKKASARGPTTTVRTVKGAPTPTAAAGPNSRSAAAATSQAVLDGGDNLPRADISQAIVPLLRDMTGSKDWKERFDAMKRIEAQILHNNKNIASPGVSEMFKALKLRLDEPNRNFVADALRMMSLVVEAAGGAARPGLKFVFCPVAALLGDQKQGIRDEAAKVIGTTFALCGVEPFVKDLPRFIVVESAYGKFGMVDQLAKVLGADDAKARLAIPPRAMAPLIAPLLRLMLDRNADVRSRAQVVLSITISNTGREAVARAMDDLKPAERKSIEVLVQRAASAAPEVARPQQMTSAGGAAAPSLPAVPTRAEIEREMAAMSLDDAIRVIEAGDMRHMEQASNELIRQVGLGNTTIANPALVMILLKRIAGLWKINDFEFPGQVAFSVISVTRTLMPCAATQLNAKQLSDCLLVLFDCLTINKPMDTGYVKMCNDMVSRCVALPEQDTIFRGLMDRLTADTAPYLLDASARNYSYIQLAVRCIIRASNTLEFTLDTVLREVNEYLEAFPPSRFKDRDDVSIRVLKSLLRNLCKKYGDQVRVRCVQLVGTKTLLHSFICMDEHVTGGQQQIAASRSTYHEDPEQPRASTTRRSTLAPMTTNVPPRASEHPKSSVFQEDNHQPRSISVAEIFAKVRKHETTDEGVQQLYSFVKANPNSEEFESQFAACSEAFRSYLRRRLDRLREADQE